MDLKFLGCGDCYSYELGNNAAYWKDGKNLFFLDMGQSIFAKALHENILEGVKDVTIFITHCHADHMASLGEALTFFAFLQKEITFRIVFPEPEILKSYLRGAYILKGIPFIGETEGIVNGVRFEAKVAKHIPHSYCYFFEKNGERIHYSGDNAEIHPQALEELQNGKLSRMYLDVAPRQSPFHIGLSSAEGKIPLELRSKVVLMHLESLAFAEEIEKRGFDSALKHRI